MSLTNKADLSNQAKFKIAGINPQVGTSYTILTGDMGKLVTVTNASAVSVTLPQSGSAGFDAFFWFWIENLGAGNVTITPTTSTIDGAATLLLAQYQGVVIFGDGTNWFSIRGIASGGSSGLNGVNSQTVDYTAVSGDNAKLLSFNGSNKTLTLPAAPPSATWAIFVENLNATNLTISRNSLLIDGVASNITLIQNQGVVIFTDGTNYFTSRGMGVVGPAVAVDSDFVQFDGTTGKLVKDGGISLDTDTTLAASSNSRVASQHATKVYVDSFAPGGGGSLILKTNGTSNGSQALLDLIDGLGITITQDGSGHTTITGGFAYGCDGSDGALTFDGSATVAGIVPVNSLAITQATNVPATSGAISSNTSVALILYTVTGTIPDGLIGQQVTIAGFVNAGNNGTFTVISIASGGGAFYVVSSAGVSETHAATAAFTGVYTLTRDIFATSATINSSVIVFGNNFAIFCQQTLTVNGTIHVNGNTGGNGFSLGTSLNTGSSTGRYGRAVTGKSSSSGGTGTTTAGSQATAPGTGNASTNAVVPGGSTGSAGSTGGAGGTGASGAGGAARAGGAGGTFTAAQVVGRTVIAAQSNSFLKPSTSAGTAASFAEYSLPNASNGISAGGGGGGGDGTNSGATGGSSGSEGAQGGWLGIFANKIVVGAAGIISCNGGQGGYASNGNTGSAGNIGGGGGGAGGAGAPGGVLYLVYHTLSNSGTIQAVGGVAGVHGFGGTGHGTGTNGTNGADGPTGLAGVVIQLQC